MDPAEALAPGRPRRPARPLPGAALRRRAAARRHRARRRQAPRRAALRRADRRARLRDRQARARGRSTAVNRELGTTTVVITHNAAIAGMADRVIRLRSGQHRRRSQRNARARRAGRAGLVSSADERPRPQAAARPLAPARPGRRRSRWSWPAASRIFVTLRSMHRFAASTTQARYYAQLPLRRRLRPAEARARSPSAREIAAIPGVAAVETRIVVRRDRSTCPGLRRAGDRPARLDPRAPARPLLNDLHLRRGPLARRRAARRGARQRGVRRAPTASSSATRSAR